MTETLLIQVRDALEPILIENDFVSFINDLNVAALAGKQYVIAQETDGGPIALETRNITAVRIRKDDDAIIGE